MRKITNFVSIILFALGVASTSRAAELDREFKANSKTASDLVASSRLLEDYGMDYFLASYSIKFQGCHEVSQWKGNSDDEDEDEDEDDLKVISRKLVRFRMCPIAACNDNKDGGCSSKYGDFIVDINTFVYYYLSAKQQQQSLDCDYYGNTCQQKCNTDDDNSSCMQRCYKTYGVDCSEQYDDQNEGYSLDPLDYANCAAFEGFGNGAYYLGPTCSDEDSKIYLALYSDDECTTSASCDESCFYNEMGYNLPYSYSDQSVVSSKCVSCSSGSNMDDFYADPLDDCIALYDDSGKCETKMYVSYPNESACTYIEGMKYIRADGVIASAVRKSKVAAMVIGMGTAGAICLGFYVNYLNTKLSRARFSLQHNTGVVL